jgi:periplasmic protein TonB
MKRIIIGTFVLGLFATLAVLAQNKPPDFQPVQVVSAVEPAYPVMAIFGGTVVLDVTVGPQGEIENIDVARAAPGFSETAMAAIKQWKFKPATLNGQPITSVVPVAFSFSQPAVWWTKGSATSQQSSAGGLFPSK